MKKKIWFILAIILCIVIIFIVIFLNLTKESKNDINTIAFKSDIEIEVGSKVHISELLEKIDGKLISDYYLDASEVRKDKSKIEYYDENNKKHSTYISYEIVDTTSPVVMLNNTYTVQVGYNKDLANSIFCADNYDKNPKCLIEGNYNLNEVGEYNLKYIAIDSSNNKTEIDFKLKVVEKTSSGSTTTSFRDIYNKHKSDTTEIGIDVSKWQGNINWTKVKEAGATFAMIRLGYQAGYDGESKLDPYFKSNIESAVNAGIKVGVYYFSYATSTEEALEQANWIIKQLDGKKLDLPIVFDWENWSTFNDLNLSLIDINNISNVFLETVEKRGYIPMLYGSKNYLEKVWDYNGKVWLAHYTSKTTYEGKYLMWQLCSNGRIDGINGNVDIDVMYKE